MLFVSIPALAGIETLTVLMPDCVRLVSEVSEIADVLDMVVDVGVEELMEVVVWVDVDFGRTTRIPIIPASA